MLLQPGKLPLDRRRLLGGLGALGGASALGLQAGRAQTKASEVVIANYGGTGTEALKKAFTDDFVADTGILVAYDGSGPTNGRIRSMLDGGKVLWDICDCQADVGISLGPQGMLEEIDYSIVDKAKVPEELAQKYAVGSYYFSYVLAYNKKVLGGKIPRTWADFWNTAEFPGKRTISRYAAGAMEAALLADGVPMDKLYPLDVKRSLDKIRQIKSHLLLWRTGAESVELLRTGEVGMGILWNTRGTIVKNATNSAVDFHFNQGMLVPSMWAVPKGNPAGREKAMRLIAYMQNPAKQAKFLEIGLNGPVNLAANALLSDEMRAQSCSGPQNLAQQFKMNVEWWAENRSSAEQGYIAAIS